MATVNLTGTGQSSAINKSAYLFASPVFVSATGRLSGSMRSGRPGNRIETALTDGLRLRHVGFPFAAWGVVASSGVGVHQAQTPTFLWGRTITARVKFDSTVLAAAKFGTVLIDNPGLHLTQTLAIPRSLTSGVGVHLGQANSVAVAIIQKLKAGSTLTPNLHFGLSLLTNVGVHADLSRALTLALTSGVGLHPTVARQYQGVSTLAQSLALSAVLGKQWIISFALSDGFDVTDASLLKAIYTGTLTETVRMYSIYVDPGGGYATWAINTRTNAVSEYQDYFFNSIAKLGRLFVGARDDGLYLLDGPQDDGVAIPTHVKSGLMQIAGSRFTSFKAAYLGLSTSDDAKDFLLKLVSGDGREYVYAVKPNAMQTTKVNMGKGLRARYFSFELETLAADYSLDTIEFIPVSSQRRV